MNLINYVHEQLTPKRAFPEFRPGDNISVSYKIIEGAKERIQIFRGDVIQINGEKKCYIRALTGKKAKIKERRYVAK